MTIAMSNSCPNPTSTPTTTTAMSSTELPPFLRLPPELHFVIGRNLDLFTLSHLRCTCKLTHGAYARSQLQRASFILGIYIQYQDEPETERKLKRHYPDEDFDDIEEEEDEIVGNPWIEDELVNNPWILTFFDKVVELCSPEELQQMMRYNGAWDEVEEVIVLLCDAIILCGAGSKREEDTAIVGMLAERVKELGGQFDDKFQPVLEAVRQEKIKCLEVLYKTDFYPWALLGEERLKQLVLESIERLSYSIFDWNARYEIFELLIEELGAQVYSVTDKAPTQLIDLSILERFINAFKFSYLERPSKGIIELYERILALFIRNGLDLHEISVRERHNLKLLTNSDSERITKMLLRAGYCLGPFPDRRTTSYIHTFAWSNDIELLELLLEQGCSVDFQSDNGDTPLLIILRTLAHRVLGNEVEDDDSDHENAERVNYKCRENIRFLLSNGADPFIVNDDGFTAVTIAMVIGYQNVIDDMIEFDCRRQERYGSLTPKEVYKKWMDDDELWTGLVTTGTVMRYNLELQLVKLPQRQREDELEYYLYKQSRFPPRTTRFPERPRGWDRWTDYRIREK